MPSETVPPAERVQEPDWFEHSPDGRWAASVFGYYPPVRMEVAQADGSAIWHVEYARDDWAEVSLRPAHWSREGRYLYYTLRPAIDGFFLYVSGAGLWRLDLTNGAVHEILPGGRQLYSFAVSPDSTRLGFIRRTDAITWLVVRDLFTAQEFQWRLTDERSQAGAITWSADSSRLVVLVTKGLSFEDALSSVVLADLKSHGQKTLLRDDPRLFYRVEWVDARTVYLEDWQAQGWKLDVISEQILPVPTPTKEA